LEQDFGQSCEAGLLALKEAYLAEGVSLHFLEHELLRRLALTEKAEWLSIYDAQFSSWVGWLRGLSCRLAKRSIACVRGEGANWYSAGQYRAAIRDQDELDNYKDALLDLLQAQPGTYMDLFQSFGQARDDSGSGALASLAELTFGNQPNCEIEPAPAQDPSRPAHDLPIVQIVAAAAVGSGAKSSEIPLTYEIFLALHERRLGCSAASLSPSTRAVIDRLRQLFVGEYCHDIGSWKGSILKVFLGNREYKLKSSAKDKFKVGV